MRRFLTLIAGAVALALAVAGQAAADTLTFTPVADSYVRSDSPSTNFGSSSELRARGGGSLILNSYLRFNVTGAGTVSQATLRLRVTDPSPASGSVYRVTDTTWSETGITYSNAPPPSGAALDTEPSAATAGTWVELDVTAAVTGDGLVSFQVQNSVSDAVFFSSRQGANPPQLVVTTGSGGSSAPVNTSPPTVAGVPQVEQTVTADPGTWSGTTPISYAYQWQRCSGACSDIAGATGQTYLVPAGDLGFTLRVVVTATNSVGQGTAASAETVTVTEPSPSSVITFTPTADAYVRSSSSNGNFGTATFVRARGGSTVMRAYFRFAVSGLSGPPVSARLRLIVTDKSALGGIAYHVADSSWTETGITYANAPPTSGDALSRTGAVSNGAVIELDLDGVVTGDGTYSFAITSTSSDAADYSSREGANPPQLVLVTQASPDPVIAAAGDIACDPGQSAFNGGNGVSDACRQKYTSDLLVGAGLAAVLPLGDTQYLCGGYAAYLQSYDPSWGRVKSITRPAPGNHEYLTSYPGATDCSTGASGYYTYFGAAAGDPSKGYYSYDVGDWHLIALNSNCAEVGGCGAGSPQEQWLRSDLAASSASCTLAYWHHPRFSSGDHGSDATYQAFWQALYDYNADVVLTGHDHSYERFGLQTPTGTADSSRGIRQFTVGTGGVNLRRFQTVVANSEVREGNTFGVLKLTLHPAGYDWRFVSETGKTFTDSGSASCH